ncbi:MAG TPA: ATP-binding protein [Methylomirabilota bacterium]|jgi:signal transduction histidine kinase|nr:ATP-binding protein [Methylomirabilota bacterium]
MRKNPSRPRSMSLREAASVVFALVALLPILLMVYLLSRHELMRSGEAQVGLVAAIGVSVLGFLVFRRMMDQISALAQGFIAPTEAKPETLRRVERASAVPGLGEVTEIGQVRDAFYHMLDDLRGSTQRLEDLVFKLGTLNEMVELAARIPRIQDLLGLVLQSTMRAVRATVGSIMILDRERTVLKLAASRGIPDDVIPQVEVKVGEGVAGKVVEMGEPVLVDDIATDPRFNRTNNPQYSNGSFICMPIRVGDRVIGVINMAKRRDGAVSDALRLPPFGSTDLQFLNALMTYIGYAVDNSRLLEEAQSSATQLQGVVDDLKSTQAQLVRGETLRAMGQLSSGMAHHLNNLFAVILGRVELLMGKVQETSVRRSLEIIQRTAQDGAEVVRRVQRFSRVQPVSDAVAVDLNQLVHEVVELTRPRWQDEAQLRGSRIEVAVEAGVIGAAAGEPAPLREVLMNLLINAADSISQAGKVTLKTWTRDDRVYCSVTDTGGGMPEEVRRRALEPFFTTKGPKATGLGLSVAYGTVQRYGGTLTVESAEGQGTTVEVSLPTASAAASVARTPTAARTDAIVPLRILVIDDELQVRATLAEMLEEQGHSVTQAPGGREGLSYLESNPQLVDVVISDLGMPDMNGWDVAKSIQGRWPRLPVGLITGWGETEISREERSRVNFVITKPFDKAVLRETMSDIRPRA